MCEGREYTCRQTVRDTLHKWHSTHLQHICKGRRPLVVGTANSFVLQRNKIKSTAEHLCVHVYVCTVHECTCTCKHKWVHVHAYLHSDGSPHLLLPNEVHEDPFLVHVLASCSLHPQWDSGREEEGLRLAGGCGLGEGGG